MGQLNENLTGKTTELEAKMNEIQTLSDSNAEMESQIQQLNT